MRRVEVGDLIGETVAAFRTAAAERGVKLAADLPRGEVVAEADAERVQRVLFNLIQNAIRHTPADGSVTVRARRGADGVEVEVADSGEGVPAGEGERVFDAFYRGDSSRGEGGAGLGLAISRAIVEAHGGRIWLEDGAPGTRVHFTLPAT
jgi:signal transduction histidine kinase